MKRALTPGGGARGQGTGEPVATSHTNPIGVFQWP